ncbi:MAG: hypothetical protein AABM33_07620 [Pseudomonadota bacterium]
MDAKIDLERVADALFKDPKQRGRIARDYGISDQFGTAGEFVDRLVKALDQAPVADPLTRENLSPRRVYRAAVMALGSNSRKWAAFLRQEEALSRKLHGYDPEKLSVSDIHVEELLPYFPGLTCTKDAKAVVNWLARLKSRDFSEELVACTQAVENAWAHSFSNSGDGLKLAHRMPVLSVFMSQPQILSEAYAFLSESGVERSASALKLPGMGPTLASEFFRNLGWSGFKPDRHVRRLLERWLSSAQRARFDEEVRDMALMLGWGGNNEVEDFLRYSIAGLSVTPDEVPYSRVDNLVWLLGAYVEKKNRESEERYLL